MDLTKSSGAWIDHRDDNDIPLNSSKASIEHSYFKQSEARTLLTTRISGYSVHPHFGLHDHDALGS